MLELIQGEQPLSTRPVITLLFQSAQTPGQLEFLDVCR